MGRDTTLSHAGFPVDRHNFWLATPQRYVVDRGQTTSASGVSRRSPQATSATKTGRPASARCAHPPHYLNLIVAANAAAVESTAFLQPILPTPGYTADGPVTGHDADSPRPQGDDNAVLGVDEKGVIALMFVSVPIYVWTDTTLREVVETVIQRSPVARKMLWPLESPAEASCFLPNRCAKEGPANTTVGDEDAAVVPKPPRKVPRREAAADSRPRMVRVSHVFPGPNRLPQVQTIGALRLDRPHVTSFDHITIEELQCSQKTRFKLGDLLVLAPVD